MTSGIPSMQISQACCQNPGIGTRAPFLKTRYLNSDFTTYNTLNQKLDSLSIILNRVPINSQLFLIMNQTPPRYNFFICPILTLQKIITENTVAIHFFFNKRGLICIQLTKVRLFEWQQVRNHIHENQGAIHSSNQ